MTEVTVKYKKSLCQVKCEGIELHGAELTGISGRQYLQNTPLLEKHVFTFYEDQTTSTTKPLNYSLNAAVEIILQNCQGVLRQVKICEIISESSHEGIMEQLGDIFSRKPLTVIEYVQCSEDEIDGKYDVLVCANVDVNTDKLADYLFEDGFLICIGHFQTKNTLDIIYSITTEIGNLYLLRKCAVTNDHAIFVDVNDSDEFFWVDELKKYITSGVSKVIYLVGEAHKFCGVIGLVNCLNKEPSMCKFKCILMDKTVAFDEKFHEKQLKKNLVLNVLRHNRWGTYVYLPLQDIQMREVTEACVQISTVGNLSTLEWTQQLPVHKQ